MIQKIGLNINTKNYKKSIASKENQNKQIQNTTNTFAETPSSKLLQSYYVNFSGRKAKFDLQEVGSKRDKIEELENNFSYHGEKLYKDAQALAKKYGHNEITQIHVLKTGLENIKNFIDELDSGEANYDDESSFTQHTALEDDLGRSVIKDKIKRDKIRPIIEKEIEVLDKKLATTPASQSKSKKPEFSKDFLNDIYSLYSQDNDEEMGGGDGLVHDATIFSAALFPNNDQLKKEVMIPFRTALKDEIQIDKRPLSKRIHMSFYDDKALNIWNNLAIGTNMAILHDKDTTPGYLVNSFLNVFEKSKNGFGKLTKENTEIINLNDNGEIDNYYIKKKLHEFGKNKDKNYVLVMSIMDKDMDAIAIDETNVATFLNAPQNVKFVMVADKDEYYKDSTKSDVVELFSDFGEISMPLMNMSQAQKMFKEQPKLTEKLKKPFTKQAIEKCVEVANQLKGNYPEKAQKVMDLVAAYHVDKEKVTLVDVQNYVKEAKEIFKPVENDSSIKVVFDTGIKLKDMVGTPSTKKEAKSIIDRIKDKSIGTKGFVIYSQDGSVGAGRKYTAQTIAGEAKVPYIEINAVDFGTKDVDLFGGGNLSPEASMKKLFGMVKAQAETNNQKSAVLFVENFDYFSYGEFVSEYHEKAMSQLIREMNKAQEQGMNIVVIGSMNDPKNIGEATSKSFKFIDRIEVESPGYTQSRNEVIDYYIKKKAIKLAGNEEAKKETKAHLNLLTEQSSYIEILTLLDKAQNVAREKKHKTVEKSDFTEAYLQLTTGRPSSRNMPQYEKDLVASHECGHALNATIMDNLADNHGKPWHKSGKVNFITLDPRGWFGGAVYTTDMDNEEYSFEHIFSSIICDFGGNSCEKKFFNQDGSWGISSDMEMATNLATRAVGMMGQGKHFGKKSLSGMHFMGEDDKANMNKDINVILKNAQVISEAITEVYADFNKEFVKKYGNKVGTGECIIQREEFIGFFEDWKSKQPLEKQQEFHALDKAILDVIEATKRGTVCYREN